MIRYLSHWRLLFIAFRWYGSLHAPPSDSAHKQGNKPTHITVSDMVTNDWNWQISYQSTYSRDGDVFGHRGRCRARMLVPSLGPLNNADRSSSSRSSYDEAGWLSQDQQAMCLVPPPPGGALRGCCMFIVCNFRYSLSMLYSLITKVRNEQNLDSHTRKMSPEKNSENSGTPQGAT